MIFKSSSTSSINPKVRYYLPGINRFAFQIPKIGTEMETFLHADAFQKVGIVNFGLLKKTIMIAVGDNLKISTFNKSFYISAIFEIFLLCCTLYEHNSHY